MIKLNNKEISLKELEKHIRKSAWLGKEVNHVHLVAEAIYFKETPYICLCFVENLIELEIEMLFY